MRKTFVKLFFAMLPALVLVIIYFIKDPFKVLYHYDSYYPPDGIQYVMLNNDYTSTQTFLNNYSRNKYDSYIFGNSRGMLFHVNEWEQHVPGGHYFQFSVSNESLYGIERKLHLIDSLGGSVKNALFVLDYFVYGAATENDKFPKHPALTGRSKLEFELNSFKGFFDPGFLLQYLKLLITGQVQQGVFASALNCEPSHYDVRTNDLSYPYLDKRIDADTGAFYRSRRSVFYKRPNEQQYTESFIGQPQLTLLKRIKAILNKDNTSYKIVISPIYNQLKINQKDFEKLSLIFGKENIFDFSGINSITENMYNYYESAHYRPMIANRIMDSIYKKQPFPAGYSDFGK